MTKSFNDGGQLVPPKKNRTEIERKPHGNTKRRAPADGILPHEWLRNVMRGDPIEIEVWNEEARTVERMLHYPTFEQRLEAAKIAAPYYAPRLSAQSVDISITKKLEEMDDRTLLEHLGQLIDQVARQPIIDIPPVKKTEEDGDIVDVEP